MAIQFSGVPRTYNNAALTTTAVLALTRGSVSRAGVIITNNTALGGADILVSMSSDFGSAPAAHAASPTARIAPGEYREFGAGVNVAIWVSSSISTASVSVTELER